MTGENRELPAERGLTRRQMLGRTAAGGAMVWTAPVVDSMASPAAAASGAPVAKNCVVAASTIPANQTACQKVNVGTKKKVGQTFDMTALFTNDAKTGATCACCEYRQYIRGSFTYDGRPVELPLPNPVAGGAPLALQPRPNGAFREDGLVNPKTLNAHYGHRDELPGNTDPTDRYTPAPRATGCTYSGNDFPGLTANAGKAYSVALDFRGQIIDVCNGNKVIVTREWSVDCSSPPVL